MATDNIGNDDVFAQLTELFGELLSADLILNVCTTYNWQCKFFSLLCYVDGNYVCVAHYVGLFCLSTRVLTNKFTVFFFPFLVTDCIDTLVKHTSSGSDITADGLPIDDDLDIIIESEEIQTFPASSLSIDSKPFYPTGAIRKTNSEYQTPADTTPQPLMSSFLKHGPNEFRSDRHHRKQPRISVSQLQHTDQMDNIFSAIQRGQKIMILMRGPPGCGKTYLSREIINKTMSGDYANHIYSTDDYFLDARNRYHYDRSKLTDAHEYNKERVRDRTENGWSPIVVDNTMNKAWELYPYVDMAVRHGYIVEIVEVKTPWSKSAGRLAGKNRHNVGRDIIERMLTTYEATTVDDVMRTLNLRYQCLMPQLRCYPLAATTDDDDNYAKRNRQSSNDAGNNNNNNMEVVIQQVEPVWSNGWQQQQRPSKCFDDFVDDSVEPKPPRSSCDAFASNVKQLDNIDNEWTTYEKERIEFWSKNDATPPTIVAEAAVIETDPNKDMPTVDKEISHQSKMCSILKSSSNETTDASTDVSGTESRLERHAIGCDNENSSFAQIRQIYPTVGIEILWDLFRHCNGDPDWTMDILLKEETRIDDYKKLDDGADPVDGEFLIVRCVCV